MSKISRSCSWQVKKLLRRLKAPEIIETSPPGQKENHERYLAEDSAAIKNSNCHLPLVRNMGSCPGDELQVVHPLHLSGLLPILIADLALLFVEEEAFQGKKRPPIRRIMYLPTRSASATTGAFHQETDHSLKALLPTLFTWKMPQEILPLSCGE